MISKKKLVKRLEKLEEFFGVRYTEDVDGGYGYYIPNNEYGRAHDLDELITKDRIVKK